MFELSGKLAYNVSFTQNGKPIVSLEMDDKFPTLAMVDKLHDEKLSIKFSKATGKRGLTANAYYWKLLSKLSQALEISNNHCHNLMLRIYGVLEEFDGQNVYWVIPDTEEASRKADEAETYHIKPTSSVREGKDGLMYRTYLLLKGSHSYTRAEFSRLVNGLVDECHHMGIPTRSQEDIDSLLAMYEVSK